jgi:excisionase family DNA binding protein
MNERDQLMTPEQLVEYLNLPSVQVIYKWNATGTGPAYFKVGRHCRFRRSEVDEWLETRRDEVSSGR